MADRTREKRDRSRGIWRPATCAFLGLGLVVLPVAGQSQPAVHAQPDTAAAYYGLPSEKMAVMLSVIGTAVAAASLWSGNAWVALAGLSIGPSLGFLYGNCWGRGFLSAGLRLGATFALAAAALSDDEHSETYRIAWIAGMAASAVLDMATVRMAVRRQNARRLAGRGLNVAVSPFALPKGAGVQVRLSF
jgi:hypothetical protein